MRGNNNARFTHSFKFEGNLKYVESALQEGNALRKKLEGKRILLDDHSNTTMTQAFVEALHV